LIIADRDGQTAASSANSGSIAALFAAPFAESLDFSVESAIVRSLSWAFDEGDPTRIAFWFSQPLLPLARSELTSALLHSIPHRRHLGPKSRLTSTSIRTGCSKIAGKSAPSAAPKGIAVKSHAESLHVKPSNRNAYEKTMPSPDYSPQTRSDAEVQKERMRIM
jgi:hypothetical protein